MRLVLSTVVMLFVMAGCSSNNNQSSSVQSTPVPPASKASNDSETPEIKAIMAEAKGEKWGRVEYTNPDDGRKRVIFDMTSPSTPGGETLNIRCGMGGLGMWVSLAPPENGNVRIAVDEAPFIAQKWDESPKHDLLTLTSAKPSKELIAQLVAAKTFKFEYTPKGASPKTLTFNILNLKELLAQEPICKK